MRNPQRSFWVSLIVFASVALATASALAETKLPAARGNFAVLNTDIALIQIYADEVQRDGVSVDNFRRLLRLIQDNRNAVPTQQPFDLATLAIDATLLSIKDTTGKIIFYPSTRSSLGLELLQILPGLNTDNQLLLDKVGKLLDVLPFDLSDPNVVKTLKGTVALGRLPAADSARGLNFRVAQLLAQASKTDPGLIGELIEAMPRASFKIVADIGDVLANVNLTSAQLSRVTSILIEKVLAQPTTSSFQTEAARNVLAAIENNVLRLSSEDAQKLLNFSKTVGELTGRFLQTLQEVGVQQVISFDDGYFRLPGRPIQQSFGNLNMAASYPASVTESNIQALIANLNALESIPVQVVEALGLTLGKLSLSDEQTNTVLQKLLSTPTNFKNQTVLIAYLTNLGKNPDLASPRAVQALTNFYLTAQSPFPQPSAALAAFNPEVSEALKAALIQLAPSYTIVSADASSLIGQTVYNNQEETSVASKAADLLASIPLESRSLTVLKPLLIAASEAAVRDPNRARGRDSAMRVLAVKLGRVVVNSITQLNGNDAVELSRNSSVRAVLAANSQLLQILELRAANPTPGPVVGDNTAPGNGAVRPKPIPESQETIDLQRSFRWRAFRAGTVFGNLYRALVRDPEMSRVIRDRATNEGKREEIASNKRGPNDPSQISRPLLVAMSADEKIREVAVRAAQADMNAERDEFMAQMNARPRGSLLPGQVFDLLIVGAGPHGTIGSNVVKNLLPDAIILNVDRASEPSSNFRSSAFRVNSSSSPDEQDVIPEPKRGNKNLIFGAPLQIPDFDPNRFPEARSLYASVNLDLLSAGTNVYLSTELVDTFDSVLTGDSWPARYKVLLNVTRPTANGIKSERIEVYANHVAFTSGLGATKNPGPDPDSRQLIDDRASRTTPEQLSDIVYGEQYLSWLEDNKGRNPYNLAGKTIIVEGKGDTAYTIIEYLLRLVSPKAYGLNSAQSGYPAQIIWYGQNALDCEKYINEVRLRYADVGLGYQAGLIKAVPSKAGKTVAVPGGYRVYADDGTYEEANQLILATGKESTLYKSLRGIVSTDKEGRGFSAQNPLEKSSAVNSIMAEVGGNVVPIGRRLNDVTAKNGATVQSNVYFTGPGSGTDQITDADLKTTAAKVSANKVSLFVWGPRTEKTFEIIAGEIANGPRAATARTQLKGVIPPASQKAVAAGGPGVEVTIYPPTSTSTATLDVDLPLAKIYLQARIAAALRDYQFDPSFGGQLTVQVTGGATPKLIFPGVNITDAQTLQRRIEADEDFVKTIGAIVGSAKQAAKSGGYLVTLDVTSGRVSATGSTSSMRAIRAGTSSNRCVQDLN